MRKNASKVKQNRPIDALFPKTRQGILRATFGQPDREWYVSELATYLQTTPSSLQRELESLASSGILRRRQDGNRLYYQASGTLPIFTELRGIVEKTLGVSDALEVALSKFKDGISSAFIYGSVAGKSDRAESDVDLLIVGSVGLEELSPVLHELENRLGRELNAVCYSLNEFRDKLRSNNHFLTSVMKSPKIFVKGGPDELAAIVNE